MYLVFSGEYINMSFGGKGWVKIYILSWKAVAGLYWPLIKSICLEEVTFEDFILSFPIFTV